MTSQTPTNAYDTHDLRATRAAQVCHWPFGQRQKDSTSQSDLRAKIFKQLVSKTGCYWSTAPESRSARIAAKTRGFGKPNPQWIRHSARNYPEAKESGLVSLIQVPIRENRGQDKGIVKGDWQAKPPPMLTTLTTYAPLGLRKSVIGPSANDKKTVDHSPTYGQRYLSSWSPKLAVTGALHPSPGARGSRPRQGGLASQIPNGYDTRPGITLRPVNQLTGNALFIPVPTIRLQSNRFRALKYPSVQARGLAVRGPRGARPRQGGLAKQTPNGYDTRPGITLRQVQEAWFHSSKSRSARTAAETQEL